MFFAVCRVALGQATGELFAEDCGLAHRISLVELNFEGLVPFYGFSAVKDYFILLFKQLLDTPNLISDPALLQNHITEFWILFLVVNALLVHVVPPDHVLGRVDDVFASN
jgi:hypothetical protein